MDGQRGLFSFGRLDIDLDAHVGSKAFGVGRPKVPQGLPDLFAIVQAGVLHKVRLAHIGSDGCKEVDKGLHI